MEKEEFLKLIMFRNSWDSAVQQRGGGQLYDDDVPQKEQNEAIGKIKPKIKSFIETMLKEQYKAGGVDDEKHFSNIKALQKQLADSIKTDATGVFAEDCLLDHIATAQKLLNVMCKSWWSAGWLGENEPPHCPVDRIVCKELPKSIMDAISVKGRFAWTYSLEDDKECCFKDSNYGKVIAALREAARASGYESLAQWELELWHKKVYKED